MIGFCLLYFPLRFFDIMEFIHEYDSTSDSSGESSNENNEELLLTVKLTKKKYQRVLSLHKP